MPLGCLSIYICIFSRLLDDDVLQITNSLNPTNPSARVHFVSNGDIPYFQQRNDVDTLDDLFLVSILC